MAGGTIVIAHNSGGPKLDIVKDYNSQATGFLADDASSYAHAMNEVVNMSQEARTQMQQSARLSVDRFSDQHFEATFLDSVKDLLQAHS